MEVTSPVLANVWRVLVSDGQKVLNGEVLLILESMKMEIPVEAMTDGIVHLHVLEGDSVDEGETLLTIEMPD